VPCHPDGRAAVLEDKVMGIFGALTTAVTGMRAQSFALENVSGNIANSQTTGFKRIDTSFTDLIPDNIPSKQLAGSVQANSRNTNTVQGDIQNASIGTFMAINGDGFFVVQKPDNFVDNNPVFAGIENYTRRGDFQPDKNGYLVNGAGYYLMGIPVDPTTGNLTGSVPQLLKFQSDFLPAQQTTTIDYRVNLARIPNTNDYDSSLPGSELMNPAAFSANPLALPNQPAKVLGFGASLQQDAAVTVTGSAALPANLLNGGTFTINGVNVALTVGMTPAQIETAIDNAMDGNVPPIPVEASLVGGKLVLTGADADTPINIGGTPPPAMMSELGLSIGANPPVNLLTQGAVAQGQTLTFTISGTPFTVTFGTDGSAVPPEVSTLAELSARLAALPPALGTAVVDTSNGNITITANGMTAADTIVVSGTASAKNFGIQTLNAYSSDGTVRGNDLTTFLDSSIGGGAVTAYDVSGSPVNIQLRWAKVDSAATGGTDTWNLFYQESSTATGNDVAWRNAGVNYTFGANGQMSPLVATLALNNVTVDGITLGTVQLVHGSGGVTQFADPNGNAQVNLLKQNGFPAGTLQTVSVSEKGRIVGSYSNGRTIDLAEITLANFNGANFLKRIDGGAFEVTDESGTPTYGGGGKIVGSSLEGSNTDIADEFTKLIVTQQAYSANTRVISTSNDMVQDLLNMLR
jgi:flagellar hook protein FlgE